MIKPISSTSIFNYANTMGGDKISACLTALISDKSGAIYPTDKELEDVFYKMGHKSFNFQAKYAVINLFRKGIIKLVYNNEVKLTVAMPFFKFKLPNGGFGVIINISNYARRAEDGVITIDTIVLYTLMLAAAFSLIEDENTGLVANNGMPEMYADMFTAVCARMISLDQVRRDKYKFIFAKFMYMQLGINEKSASEGAAKIVRYLDNAALEQIDLAIPAAAYENLEKLIDCMREKFPEFETVTFGLLFDRWVRSYGESSAFAIESPTMFIFVFIALIANCNNLVNVKSIEKEANRHSSKLTIFFTRIENAVSTLGSKY